MFKKRRGDADEDQQMDAEAPAGDEADEVGAGEGEGASDADAVGAPDGGDAGFDRREGPWDSGEIDDDDDEVIRIDFGSLQVPGVDGMSVSLEVDEASEQVMAVTVGVGEGAVQLQPFAAPRSGGFWQEVRQDLAKGITSSGGTVDEEPGPLGVQLRANVPGKTPDGENVIQAVRFVGVDGPRWLLRAVMLGEAAADARVAELFEDIVRGCVVRRGQQPMAPGDLLPLAVPEEAAAAQAEAEAAEAEAAASSSNGRDPLDPFERGPEITEIR